MVWLDLQLFEGMKAYRGVDGKTRLFRPDLNMKRLLRGADRALLPPFEPEEFLQCLKRLIKIEDEWIPHSESSSLYIRPTFIGTDVSYNAWIQSTLKKYRSLIIAK